jgi:DNA-binding NarL/FixJ family response regulator
MPRKSKPAYAQQPAVAAVLKMLQRARGATAAEIAKVRDLEPHTVRAGVSRLGSKAGVSITRERTKRGLVYRAAR